MLMYVCMSITIYECICTCIFIFSLLYRFSFLTGCFHYIPPTDKFTFFALLSSLNNRVKANTSIAGPLDTSEKIDADIVRHNSKQIDNNNKNSVVAELEKAPNKKVYRYSKLTNKKNI